MAYYRDLLPQLLITIYYFEMKISLLLVLLFNIACRISAQTSLISTTDKLLIDSSCFGKFSSVGGPKISNDGQYALYHIENRPVGKNTLMICRTDGTVLREFQGPSGYLAEFSNDSKNVIFAFKNDLCSYSLQTGQLSTESNVESFKLSNSHTEYVAWLTSSKRCVLKELRGDKNTTIAGVDEFWFMNNGNSLLLKVDTAIKGQSISYLLKIDIPSFAIDTIFQGEKIVNVVFDDSEQQCAFLVREKGKDNSINSVWHYRLGMRSANKLISSLVQNDSTLEISWVNRFSADGDKVFIALERKKERPSPNATKVDIWSYTDPTIQSYQLGAKDKRYQYAGVYNISRNTFIRLEDDNYRLVGQNRKDKLKENFALLAYRSGGLRDEDHWNKTASPSVYLCSLNDGMKTKISGQAFGNIDPDHFVLSPSEKFVVYYDFNSRQYCSYEIATGDVRTITKDIQVPLTRIVHDPLFANLPWGLAGFDGNDETALVYTNHDIYQVNLLGKGPAINLTNDYGRKHNVQFRLLSDDQTSTLKTGREYILNAFNYVTKESGYFRSKLNSNKDPDLLVIGPYVYSGNSSDKASMQEPVKARDANMYLIRRMSAKESDNYYTTKDFISFKKISDVHPERSYNWLTTELVTWKTYDGTICQGILYKPENFDSTRKYPIIFHYYESMSNNLHVFLRPDVSTSSIDIPYYVTNGYLVFTPNINYQIGRPGKSAYNAVASAADHLAKFPWVDSKKMGLQGESFGGYETLFIITQTNKFAAAFACSGVSNHLSAYAGFDVSNQVRQNVYERSQSRVGYTPWQRLDLYLENSPIIHADKVKTPLVMNNNKNDPQVPFAQGVEFFSALRRLGKRAWLLQYDEGGHWVSGKDAVDFTIRMKQFFDHYLKDAPAPRWMIYGIPASKKGIDTGLELVKEKDKNGKWVTPGEGLLIPGSQLKAPYLR